MRIFRKLLDQRRYPLAELLTGGRRFCWLLDGVRPIVVSHAGFRLRILNVMLGLARHLREDNDELACRCLDAGGT